MKHGRILAGAFLALGLIAAGQQPAAPEIGKEQLKITKPITGGMPASVPEAWKIRRFGKNDFEIAMTMGHYRPPADPEKKREYDEKLRPLIYRPLDKMPPELRKMIDIPAFNDMIIRLPDVTMRATKRNTDGTISLVPDKFIPAGMMKPGDQYVVRVRLLVRPIIKESARLALLEKVRNDREAWEEWKKKHPGMLGMYAYSEWVNEANIIHRRISKWRKLNVISEEEHKQLLKKFPEAPKTRDEYIARRIQPVLDRATDIFFNDPASLQAMDGAYCLNHLAAEHGVGSIIMETTFAFARWQLQMICHRGAARQFGIPWGWYVASYYSGQDSKGQHVDDSECTAYQISPKTGPDCGLSMSLRKRAFYLTWLTGASLFEREDSDRNWWNPRLKGPDRWTVQPEGQMYIEFYNFIRKYPDRGVPYAPVALLIPRNRGLSRNGGRAFGRYTYLPGDSTLDVFISTMYPRGNIDRLNKEGRPMPLTSTPYGELCDALTPDFKDGSTLKRVLPAYPAAILIGDYPELPEMSGTLQDYVRNGGTLILNAPQLENGNFPASFTGVKLTGKTFADGKYLLNELEPAGADVLCRTAAGRPLFTVNDVGKGKVVVAAVRYFAPSFTTAAGGAKTLSNIYNGKSRFKYAEAVLTALRDELMPMKVTGDVQYGFSRTAKGWRVYFVNNHGEKKFVDTKPEIDPTKKVTVECAFPDGRNFSAAELVSGKPLPVSGGKFTLEVKPTEFAIVDIKL